MFQVLGHELGFWESLVFLIGIGGGGYVVLALGIFSRFSAVPACLYASICGKL